MNTIIEKCKEVILLTKPDIPEKIAIQAVHYVLALAASLKRVTLFGLDENNVPLNYYGVTFANSGRGKDLSVSIAMKFVEDFILVYHNKLLERVHEANARGLEFNPPDIEHKEGTSSGLLGDRNVLDVLGIGSTNIRVEELVSTLKTAHFEDVVNTLTEGWQEGKNSGRSFRSYVSPPIKFVPINCLLYSSPEGFRDESNKQFQGFVNSLANGLSRRSYIVFDESDVQAEEEPTEESLSIHIDNIKKSQKGILEIKSYFNEILNNCPQQITISTQAELEVKRYEVKNKNIVASSPLMKNAIKAEMLNRAYKIRRLAGLYALYSGSDEVSVSDIQDAIEWTDSLSKDITIALNAETISEKIFDYLDKVNRYSSQTDIIKYYKMSAKDFKDNIAEVHTVAYDKGSILQSKIFDKEAKVMKYNLVKGKITEPDKMICSVSNDMSTFEPMNIGYKQLEDLVKGKYGKNYSAGTFIGGKRSTDNYIKRQNLIIYDVDELTTLEEAKLYLSSYRGFIATTRNHQKEKNGLVCDRYRVVLISKFEFNLDHETYKDTLTNFALLHNLEVDFPVIEPARLYYSNPSSEITYLEGEELIDLRQYIPETQEVKNTEQAIKHAEKYVGSEDVNGLDKYFLMQTSQGNRNNNLVRYGFALITKKGLDVESAKAKVLGLNSMLSDPLPEAEIQRTIFKSMERK